MVKEINDSNFQKEVLNSDKATVVDFWASWCGPCKMLSPVIDEVASELKGKMKFAKVNVDENPAISSQLRIASIPTLVVFKGGKIVDTLVGFRPKQDLKTQLQKHI